MPHILANISISKPVFHRKSCIHLLIYLISKPELHNKHYIYIAYISISKPILYIKASEYFLNNIYLLIYHGITIYVADPSLVTIYVADPSRTR